MRAQSMRFSQWRALPAVAYGWQRSVTRKSSRLAKVWSDGIGGVHTGRTIVSAFSQRLARRALFSGLVSDDCVSAPEFLPFKVFSVSFRDWDRTLETVRPLFAQLAPHCRGRPGLEGQCKLEDRSRSALRTN